MLREIMDIYNSNWNQILVWSLLIIFPVTTLSFILGFIDLESYGMFLFVQSILTYGSVGYFSAKWNRETPYTAAYFGAIVIALVSFIISNYVFNIAILLDSEGIGSNLSYAVTVSLVFATITVPIQNRREGVI